MTFFKSLQTRRLSFHFLLLGALLTTVNAFAGDAIRTEPLDSRAFSSEIEAVQAMKEHCLAESSRENAEHLGAILQSSEGAYFVTHGKAESGQTEATFAISRPASAKIVALWHTHGAPGRRTERFSIQDLETARQTGLPFYLITPKGEIRVVIPKEREKSFARMSPIDPKRLSKIREFRGLTLYGLELEASEA